MKSISEILEKNSRANRASLVVFISCGDPDIDFTEKLAKAACAAGADIVELGVPFSDPMADGPTIQAAGQRALASGTTLEKVIEMSGRLRAGGLENPFVLFSYYNPILKMGLEKAARLSRENGINSWLVVDVPLEESGEISGGLEKNGIGLVPLASPMSDDARIRNISGSGSGFLYYVTVAGVTGARKSLPAEFAERLARVRAASKLPVAAGFGISSPEMAHAAALSADAVVVGSALVDLAFRERRENGEEAALAAASEFVSSLSKSMKRGARPL